MFTFQTYIFHLEIHEIQRCYTSCGAAPSTESSGSTHFKVDAENLEELAAIQTVRHGTATMTTKLTKAINMNVTDVYQAKM